MASSDGAPAAAPKIDSNRAQCPHESGATLLERFYGLPEQSVSADAVNRGALEAALIRDQATLEFLFASVPEPQLGFDGVVEALTRALEATGHTLDRYSLPWPAGNSGAVAPPPPARPCPEVVPGVALFVHTPGPSVTTATGAQAANKPKPPRRLVLVYLVGESPIAGIYKSAFLRALGETRELRRLVAPERCQRCDEVRLVGPAFSGAVASLEQLLAHPLAEDRSFDIMTGRASNSEIKAILERHSRPGPGGRTVKVRATVIPDSALTAEFFCYLTETLGADEHDVALVTESSTVYGQGTMRALPERGPRLLEDVVAVKPKSCATAQRPRLILPMPLHISRLGAAWAKGAQTSSLKDPKLPEGADLLSRSLKRALPQVRDESTRNDVIPPLSPATVVEADRALGTILSTIYAEKIRYVGIVATDVQDKLFLAEQIRSYCPDVTLFTFENDILYTHPEVRPFLRGMLVVASYPLFTRNQQWSYPFGGFSERLQWNRDVDEGVYNAAVVLLGHSEHLLEYSEPVVGQNETPGKRPPIWISAVGMDTLFPIAFIKDYNDQGFVYENDKAEKSSHPYAPYQQGTLTLLLGLLGIGGVWLALGYLGVYRGIERARRPSSSTPTSSAGRSYHHVGPPPIKLRGLFAPLLAFLPFQLPQRRFRTGIGGSEAARQPFYFALIFFPIWLGYAFLSLLHFVQLRDGNRVADASLVESTRPLLGMLLRHSSHLGIYEGLTWKVLAVGLFCSACEVLFTVVMLDVGLSLFSPRLRDFIGQRVLRIGALAKLRWRPRALIYAGLTLVGLALTVLYFYVLVRLVNRLQSPNFNSLLFLRRTAHPGFGLSPLVPFLFGCVSVQLFGYINLLRIRMLESLATVHLDLIAELTTQSALFPDELQPEAGKLAGAASASASAAASSRSGDALNRSGGSHQRHAVLRSEVELRAAMESVAHRLESPRPGRIGLLLLATVLISITVLADLTSLEYHPLNLLFRLLFAVMLTMIGSASLSFLGVWRDLRGVLRLLDHHPLSEALERMPSRLSRSLEALLLEELPELTRKEAEAQHYQLLMNHLRQIQKGRPLAAMADLPEEHEQIRALLDELSALDEERRAARDAASCSPEAEEEYMVHAASILSKILRVFWPLRPLPGTLPSAMSGAAPTGSAPPPSMAIPKTKSSIEIYTDPVPDGLHLFLRLAEEFIAIQVVAYISRLFPLLRNLILFVTLGLLFWLLAFTSYPFQPQQFLGLFSSGLIVVVAPAVLWVFVQMNRNEVLSRLARSEPGKLTFDRRFVSQLLVYGLLPVLSLVAAQFPSVRGAAFSWLESILKLLK